MEADGGAVIKRSCRAADELAAQDCSHSKRM